MKYHIKDSRYPEVGIKQITEQEYTLIKDFESSFKIFEGVFYAYLNYLIARNHYRDFLLRIETMKPLTLEAVQRGSVYPITSLVIFANTFIDNAKKFHKHIDSKELENQLYRKMDIDSVNILRAVRNYSIHSSIPVKGSTGKYDLLKETRKYEFYIKKSDLSKDIQNKWDRMTLSRFKPEKISFEPLLKEVESVLEGLYDLIIEEYVRCIPIDVKRVLYDHVRYYKTSDGREYFPSTFTKSTMFNNNPIYGYESVDSVHLDSEILKVLVSKVNI